MIVTGQNPPSFSQPPGSPLMPRRSQV